MRKQTKDDLEKISVQEDLLKGNINRMCVTDDIGELDSMALHARKRIEIIQQINYKRLMEVKDDQI